MRGVPCVACHANALHTSHLPLGVQHGFGSLSKALELILWAAVCRRLRRYTNHCFACTEVVTEESVRDNILDLTGIDAEDLLFFSHSNIALSHLPYMVALDR